MLLAQELRSALIVVAAAAAHLDKWLGWIHFDEFKALLLHAIILDLDRFKLFFADHFSNVMIILGFAVTR